MSRESVTNSFDERSSFYLNESTWSTDEALNNLCIELLEADLDFDLAHSILDYGAGPGTLSRLLASRGHTVDVADLSQKMLDQCEFARNRFLVPRDLITTCYDRIILRQVLQYVYSCHWETFIAGKLALLRASGRLLFSQMIPFGEIDLEFWRMYTSLRRPQRVSFPTEADLLRICDDLDVNILYCGFSTRRQSLQKFLLSAPENVQRSIRSMFESAPKSIRAIRDIQAEVRGDITWLGRWVHILISP